MKDPDQDIIDEKARAFCEKWAEGINLEEKLLDIAQKMGVPFKDPRTGLWHDKRGTGFDTHEDLIRYGDFFIFLDD